MANVKKTIDIIFAGVDNVSNTVNSVSGNMADFGDNIQSATQPLASITDNILKIDAALLALSAGGLAYAFLKSKEYESAIVDLEKVMGENETVTKELGEEFTQLSRSYGESSISIVNSLAGLRQSGYSTAEGMEVLETSMKLARASELSSEEATNLLKRSMIGYNLEASDSIKLGDLWNKTSNVANTTVGKLAEGFAVVSRQAKDAGFSTTELSAALTPVIGVFDSGSEAGIALSMALTRLLNPTADGEKAIRALTGATKPLNQEFASGKDLFEAVAKGLQDVDDRTASVYTAQIVGAQQAKRVKIAFDDYFETLGKIGPAAEQYNSLQKEVDKQNTTTQASIDRLKVGFEALAITVGEQFRKSAQETIDGGTAIENALEDIIKDGTFSPLFDALNIFNSKLGDYLKGIAESIPEAFEDVSFDKLLGSFYDIGDGFKDLFSGLDLTKPEDLTRAIQGIVDSLATLITVTSGILEPIGKAITMVVSWVESTNDLDDSTKAAVGGVLGWGKVINTTMGLINPLLIAFNALASALTVLSLIKIGGWATTLLPQLTALTTCLGSGGLVGAAGAAGVAMGALARNAIPQIDTMAQKLIGFFDQLLGISDYKTEAELQLIDAEFKLSIEKSKKILKELGEIEVKAEIDSSGLKEFAATLEGLPAEAQFQLIAAWKQGDFDKIDEVLTGFTSDRVVSFDESKTVENANSVVEVTSKEIDKIPSEKEIELILKGEIEADIERIKTKAATIQAAMQWSAKVDIAEAEAAAKTIEAAFDSVSVSMESTGETLVGLATSLTGLDTSTRWKIESEIVKESVRRDAALLMQEKLTTAQIEYMDARRDALQRGESMITIDSSGLEPHIEAFMWEILEKIQTRVIEEQSDFLLGIG